MAKVLEALIAKGRRAKRPQEQKEIAFGLADLSTHGMKVIFIILFVFNLLVCQKLQM